MKKSVTLFIMFLLIITAVLVFTIDKDNTPQMPKVRSSFSPKASREMKKARDEFFFNMLRDPATNSIPGNIRRLELDFAENIAKNNKLQKTQALQWLEAGPNDVGGRTRALAVDITNPNVVIAGGVSGGIWKTTDKGNTWKMKSTSVQVLSVTSVAQDPRPGHTNTWYYTTGEYSGNTAGDQGWTAGFSGGGVYKSTDNGETWNLLENTSSPNPTSWDGNFDYSSKVLINPVSGSVFVASNAIGIFRSTNGGSSFNLVLGGVNEHIFSDVVVSSTGTLVAYISTPFSGVTPKNQPGIYKSDNDGVSWTKITPTSLTGTFQRTMLALAPSNENVLYAYCNTGNKSGSKEVIKFYKINVSTGASEDRSANLPDFNMNYNDYIHTQGNYNMVLAVQPDNENVVVLGASSLFRSLDGFATKPTEMRLGLIGGYYPENPWRYPNLHPDVHSFAFDPQNPSAMWCGHDGGLSYTEDIANTGYQKHLPWVNKNNKYNVTQYYTITIPDQAGDNRIMGGCQDNGTPFFVFDGSNTSASIDVSGGDGSFAQFGNNYAYVSSQNGFVMRIPYNNGVPDQSKGWSVIHPKNAANQLFINPMILDPNDQNVMYYTAGTRLWRNTQLASIPNYEQEGTTVGWSELNVNIPSGYFLSTMSVSKSPAHVLYFAASSASASPKVFRLENSSTSNSAPVEISVPGAAAGAYVHNIAVNPDNVNEIIIVFSNYNIVGLYHSDNGGQSYTAIEGNLTGTQQKPGPSLRAATILPANSGTNYFLATSIGVFSTTTLNGNNTSWDQEGANTLGNVVVNTITSRKSDGKIVAGTHGRGAFVANIGGSGTAVASINVQNLSIGVKPGESAFTSFTLSNTGSAPLNYNITSSGRSNSPAKADGILQVKSTPVKSKFSFGYGTAKPGLSGTKHSGRLKSPDKITGADFLILDDGSDAPDDYLGIQGSSFGWANEFQPVQDFTMDSFFFYMQTSSASSNPVYLAVIDQNLQTLSEGNLDLTLAPSGGWYQITFNTPIEFSANSKFYILVSTQGTDISYPAGVDMQGQITGKSYYSNGSNLINLNTTQFTNAAFLIRASGTLSGTIDKRLTAAPASGTISAGSSVFVNVTFNAAGLAEGAYQEQLNITTNGGDFTLPVAITVSNSVDVDEEDGIPDNYFVEQNYPNPFNPSTLIRYGLPEQSHVVIRIYDTNGKEIRELLNSEQQTGTYKAVWDGRNSSGALVSSGIYLYSVQAGSFTQTKKMIFLK